jgi:O-methyltransferase
MLVTRNMPNTWNDKLLVKLQWALASASYGITNFRHPSRAKSLAVVKESCRSVYTNTTPLECTEIYNALTSCKKVPGDIAEAGVYIGGTANLILLASPKRLHLFDTFEGLPHDEGYFQAGQWNGSLEQVQKNLAPYADRTDYHPGLFPGSAVGLEHLRFSFVHLDLDLYDSTFAALEWFWPRLSSGGMLLSHDYTYAEGVYRAFHDFFDSRTETFLPLSGNQCIAVKP